jgi:hypothetical protein
MIYILKPCKDCGCETSDELRGLANYNTHVDIFRYGDFNSLHQVNGWVYCHHCHKCCRQGV